MEELILPPDSTGIILINNLPKNNMLHSTKTPLQILDTVSVNNTQQQLSSTTTPAPPPQSPPVLYFKHSLNHMMKIAKMKVSLHRHNLKQQKSIIYLHQQIYMKILMNKLFMKVYLLIQQI
jgi:hypothetical protein